jgi:dihydropyrimidinase
MKSYLLRNGKVWQNDGFISADVLTQGDKIIAIKESIAHPSAEIIDCNGSFVLPGLIDMHVHSGEKTGNFSLSEEEKDTAMSALNGGITNIGTFITETEQDDLISLLAKRKKSAAKLPVSVHFHLTPVYSDPSIIEKLDNDSYTLKFYTTYRQARLYSSYQQIERWMEALKSNKITLLVHCEDDYLVNSYSDQHPFIKPFDHTKRRPEMVEIEAVARVLDLAVKHSYPVHIVHVSTPRAAELIHEAKKHAPVTCETAPQYLLLNEDLLKGRDGQLYLCTPPLRCETTRGKMAELAQDNYFDAFATDHCAFTEKIKNDRQKDLQNIPQGLAGTGALFPILMEDFYSKGLLSLHQIITRLTVNPAKIFNKYPFWGEIREGSAANLTVVKINKEAVKKYDVIPSLSATTNQWKGRKTSVNIKATLVKGIRRHVKKSLY